MAAHRGGIKRIIFPMENKKDLREIPSSILKDLQMIAVEHMDKVLMHALVWKKDQKDHQVHDELFEKLQKITEVEVDSGEISVAH